MHHRFERVRPRRLAAVAWTLAIAAATPGHAQELPPGPHADRMTYESLIRDLGFDAEQRVITEFLFSDYAAALREHGEAVDRAAQDAGSDRVEKAFAGQVFVAPDELRRMRVAVEEVNRAAVPESIRLLSELMEQTMSLVAPDPSHARAIADFRRRVLLEPRREQQQDQAYAGDGVDLVALTEVAMADGGELAGVPNERVHSALDRYVLALDDHLRAEAAAEHDDRFAESIARIQRDEPERQAAETRRIDRWRAYRSITQSGASDVAALAEQFGGDAARVRWEHRVRAASYPWLSGATMPEKELEWMQAHLRDNATLERAAGVVDEYRVAIDPLVDEAIGLIERARNEANVILYARMDMTTLSSTAREIHQNLLRNSGARAQAAASATDRLDALLTEGQRAQFRADLAAAAYGRRR